MDLKVILVEPLYEANIGYVARVMKNFGVKDLYIVNPQTNVGKESSIFKGMPHRRFQGKVGVIEGKRGRSYLVNLKIGDKEKCLIVRPEHITPLK